MSVSNFLRSGDHAFNNVLKCVDKSGIFDCDWFDVVDEKSAETSFENFIEDFTDYIRKNGEGLSMLDTPNCDVDVEYYMEDYISDERHDDYDDLIECVHDWVERSDDFASSEDYFTSMYNFDAGATDNEFYANKIEEFARRYWKDNKDNHHGFQTVDDLITAMKEVAIEDGNIEDVDCYDGGGYGTIPNADDYDGYIVCGCFWGGNGEEEFQLETDVPFDEKHDYNNSIYRDFSIHGDCIYTTNQWMCVYAIDWEKLEEWREENM